MRLIVKEKDNHAKEFQFSEGPISIGRAPGNHVLLPDRTVSKQHAVIFVSDDGKWMVGDLNSANKTYLNGEAVRKAEIKTGDSIGITDFTIEIDLEDQVGVGEKEEELDDTLNLEASLATPPHEIVVRKPDAGHAPAMRLAAKRLTDFSQATATIAEINSIEDLLLTLLNIIVRQFSAYHAWCALREQPSGPMAYHAGKRRDGKAVELDQIQLKDKIDQAVERGQSLVLPRVSAQIEDKERIRSAMIASIMSPAGCFGVLYVDNAMVQEHYSLSDLDYLMLLAIHTAAVLKGLIKP